MQAEQTAALFGVSGITDVCEVAAGHINRTLIVTADGVRYVLQELNRTVFRDPKAVMSNIAQTEAALQNCTDISVPHFPDCGGRNYAEADGGIWRMYAYCEGSPCGRELYRAGYAYGAFIRVMSTSNAEIMPVIEGFHDFGSYYDKLAAVCPVREIPPALTALRERLADSFDGVPTRIIHGDAKTDNVLIGEPCTVLDLDTVMVGNVALDYGDMVRSVCTGGVDPGSIRELTRGFTDGLGGLLTDKEKASLLSGVLWVTGELALRYLTDFYSEERYFRGKTREQCLGRSRELLAQLGGFLSAEAEIERIIAE